LKIDPKPNPEEVAAIMAALAVALKDHEESEVPTAVLYRSRWRLAGLLGHSVPRRMKLEGSLWSYSGWEGMV
jgi:hypothetical protein